MTQRTIAPSDAKELMARTADSSTAAVAFLIPIGYGLTRQGCLLKRWLASAIPRGLPGGLEHDAVLPRVLRLVFTGLQPQCVSCVG